MINDVPKAKHVWMVGLMIRECSEVSDPALYQSHLIKCLFVQAKSISRVATTQHLYAVLPTNLWLP
jgi:hypothetical protein